MAKKTRERKAVKKSEEKEDWLGADEEDAMRAPTEFRCRRCGKVFYQVEGEFIRENGKGYFYCHRCQSELVKEGKAIDRSKVFRLP